MSLKVETLLNNADLEAALTKLALKNGDILVVDEGTLDKAPGLLTALTATPMPVEIQVPIITAPKASLAVLRPGQLLAALNITYMGLLDQVFNEGVEAAAKKLEDGGHQGYIAQLARSVKRGQ